MTSTLHWMKQVEKERERTLEAAARKVEECLGCSTDNEAVFAAIQHAAKAVRSMKSDT